MYRLFLATVVFAIQIVATEVRALEVYLFKGAGDFSFINENAHFSRGLDRIADQLNGEGIYAEVRRYGATGDALRTIRQRRPQSVAFIGHSMGAITSMRLARKMRAEGVRVAYVATLDIPGPMGLAGGNVEWAENYYSMSPTFGLLTNTRKHPKARNIHVFSLHQSIDDSQMVHSGVLAAIRQIHLAERGAVAASMEDPLPLAPIGPVPGPTIVPHADATTMW